ncbi:MAG: hypothetical protein QM706_21415 [Nitrospira sp.]
MPNSYTFLISLIFNRFFLLCAPAGMGLRDIDDSYTACSNRSQAGEKFLVSVLFKNGLVSGDATVALADDGSAEIEVLDVDVSSGNHRG